MPNVMKSFVKKILVCVNCSEVGRLQHYNESLLYRAISVDVLAHL